MKRFSSGLILASAALLLAGCSSSDTKDGKGEGQDAEQTIVAEEEAMSTELKKVPLPCEKEELYTAWRRIGVAETTKKKTLDYKEHTPVLFISTDLDDDGSPEIILRGEPPYAAIYSFIKDSLHLITFVDHHELGLAITPDGAIIRNGVNPEGASISEFIRLKNSKVSAVGAVRETFAIRNGAMVSTGKKYQLRNDTAMVEVTADDFQKVAPQQNATYLEDIEGWEDFRKP